MKVEDRADYKYKPEFGDIVYNIMKQGGSIVGAAAHLGVSRQVLYLWANDPNKPEFQEKWVLAQEARQAYWEEIGRLGATGALPKFNASSWIHIMKCLFKDEWRDSVHTEIDINSRNKLTEEQIMIQQAFEVHLHLYNKHIILKMYHLLNK